MFTFSNECKTISIVMPTTELATSYTPTSIQVVNTLASGELISITDIDVTEGVITATGEVSELPLDGVVTITVTDGSNTDTFYTISSCQIDCCIANLLVSALECTCKCDQCQYDLIRAEKIHLMLQAARFAAENEKDNQNAIALYDKARDLCTEVCACGC